MDQQDSVRSGHRALAAGQWDRARSSFLRALDAGETAEALEGLGKASWWCNDDAATFAAREKAYRCYSQGGDLLGAARMALLLGIDHCTLRDAHAVGAGWLHRADRLLDGLDPVPETAWLELWKGQVAMVRRNHAADACRHSASAADLARSLGLLALEHLARAQEGLALERDGDVPPAMTFGDDLSAAVAGDLPHLDLVVTSSSQLMPAWEQVRNFDAIERWWGVIGGLPQPWPWPCLFWLCRIEHAAALTWRGAWDEAEAELEASVEGLLAVRGEMAAEALVRLAKLRRRQGRYEEGAALLETAEAQPVRLLTETQILLGWADLALDEGDAEGARGLVEQALVSLRGAHPSERLAGLEQLVHAEVTFGKRDRAHRALAELQHATCSVATEGVRAATRFAEGIVALAAGVLDSARYRLEEAVQLFERASAPFETAQARIELAVALSGLGEVDAARRQSAAAMEVLCQVGAAREADRAHARLPRPEVGAPGPPKRRATPSGLTSREIEVVRLAAEGLSNDAIAAQLIVSVRTVERHLSNIYEKVGASGRTARAAAVAYGLRHGLLQQ